MISKSPATGGITFTSSGGTWSTVVLRTEKGEELFSELEIGGTISTSSISSIELEHLKETSEKKRKRTKTKTVS